MELTQFIVRPQDYEEVLAVTTINSTMDSCIVIKVDVNYLLSLLLIILRHFVVKKHLVLHSP